MKNALRSIVVILSLIFTLNITVLAAPTNEKLQQQKDAVTKIQAEREEIEIKIERFDNEIVTIMAKTEENKGKIAGTEKAIKSAAIEVKRVENEVQKEQKLYNSRMRTMYINGFDGYISTILSSESFGDFISRVENIKAIIEFNRKVVGEFEATKSQLSEKKLSLYKTKKTLLNIQTENKQKLDKISISKKSQKKLITQLNSSESLLARQISESQGLASKSIAKINKIRKSTPKYVPSRGSTAVSANAVIAYASNFLGTPYLWGGTSPSTGFDCSGFTQYVYKHFGISVGRATFHQIKDGVQVSRGNLKPGDLVFFGTNNNPHHMGIYLGDNNYMHSPRTGDVIKISAMTRKDFITGRRVM
ncbi:NlpC/P60 family protein [Clostridium sp.]|jgi:cell wall-associated NlpC family hydrolase|uniref:C40 family peptidase n=1 Tax=Clostridium sp. TaxID=1506 RepID=UPI003EF05AE4